MHRSLPPKLSRDEIQRTVKGIRVEVNNGTVGPSVIGIDEKTEVRLIRQQSVRVATEGDDVFIYHNIDNPRIYMKEELKKFQVTPECASVMEVLNGNYPKYTKVTDLQTEGNSIDETILQIRELLEYGVLMTKECI